MRLYHFGYPDQACPQKGRINITPPTNAPDPPKLKAQITADPYYQKSARAKDSGCQGRITIEHAFI
jgi:hypothetical protein